jgi:hypothetical protein
MENIMNRPVLNLNDKRSVNTQVDELTEERVERES